MSVNFNDILSVRADTVEAPKALPPGKYLASVKSFEPGVSAQKKTPYVEIKFSVTQVIDVPSDLESDASATLGKGPVEMRTSFYLSEKSMYRLVNVLEKDLKLSRSGRTIGDMLTECIGLECGLLLDTETTKDGRDFIAIKRTMPA